MHAYIIGAGGTGSWLTPSLCLLIGAKRVTVMDGDKLERKNLNRQLFTTADIGRMKSDALADKYHCQSMPRWFTFGMREFHPDDWLIGVVDNHVARADILRMTDHCGCHALIAANETHSAEAYVYLPEWRGTQVDPRHYYPEIEADRTGDPRARGIGCTGEAQEANPQLVTANFMAAALAQQLFIVWELEFRKFDADVVAHLPHKLVSNLTRIESFKTGEPTPQARKEAHADNPN